MPKKKQVTLQNSIQGKFIPRNVPPPGSVFPSRANDNRFNAKMAELLASSSTMSDENEVVSNRSSQDDRISNEIQSVESPRTHSKLFHRRIATMLETIRKSNDDSSKVRITSSHTEYKSQSITFGQLRQATISSVPEQVLEDKSSSYQIKKDNEEKYDKTLISFVKQNNANSNATTSKGSTKHQTHRERLYYSSSLEQLLEQQNVTGEMKTDEKEIEKPSLTVDEILALHYSKVKLSRNTETDSPSSVYPNKTVASFYMSSSVPKWNSFQTNQDNPSPQLMLNEQNRTRPPPPSYSSSITYGHRTTSLVTNPVQHHIHPSVPSSKVENVYSGTSTSPHLLTGNSSFVLSNSTSSFTSTMNNSISNNFIRPPPPRYQSPTPNAESSQLASSQQPNIVNSVDDDNNNNNTKPSIGFDHEFSRLLYGKDAEKDRRQKQKRKAFSEPVKKCVEEANRSNEQTRRRVTSYLNKSNTVKEEEDEDDEEEENDYGIETTKLNNQKQELNFPLRRRSQRQSNFIRRNRELAKAALVPANPSLKQRVPSFLRVYSQASSSNDILLQWELFNFSELDTFYTMMSRLYKNENLARVQLYEIYRTALLSVLASKKSLSSDNQTIAITTALYKNKMNLVEKLLSENSHVHIRDDKRAAVEQTVRSLISEGRQMLHVVADFDFTLTMYEKNGVILPSTFGVIESNDQISLPDGSLLSQKAEELRLKYHPIEIDVHMDISEKLPYMIEWWRSAQSLFVLSNLTKSVMRKLVHESSMELKAGVQEFMIDLLRSETPILIFSAGLGDIIEIFLEKEIPEFRHNHESSHIVSNFIQYDNDGKLKGFSERLIHSFNKNEHEIHDTSYFQTILTRPNVILLGDTLGDVGMIGGMRNLKQILRIGYLNQSTPAKLEVYKNVYDIVICDNQTFDVPNVILKAIEK
ncbi:unnamed protein product [Rotaria socialis]|uniref:5'-nucleotidase n=1 Tax=Rotaria socialis TaxID=392032 RepID=A0A817NN72_9BILA|nr:unnamed protein product [Rotaria socialis]CAF4136549.1 unnamed protein product [Rotaria socialis]